MTVQPAPSDFFTLEQKFDRALDRLQHDGVDPALFDTACQQAEALRSIEAFKRLAALRGLSSALKNQALSRAIDGVEAKWESPYTAGIELLLIGEYALSSLDNAAVRARLVASFDVQLAHDAILIDKVVSFMHLRPAAPRLAEVADADTLFHALKSAGKGVSDENLRAQARAEHANRLGAAYQSYTQALSAWEKSADRDLAPENPVLQRAHKLAQQRDSEAARQSSWGGHLLQTAY